MSLPDSSSCDESAVKLTDLEWLKNFVHEQSNSRIDDQLLSDLYTPTETFPAIASALRAYLEQKLYSVNQERACAEETNKQLQRENLKWRRAGADKIISALDEEAVDEGRALSVACARLKLSPEEACHHNSRVDAIVGLACKATAVETRLAERECALAMAQDALKKAALQLAHATDIRTITHADIVRRSKEAASEKERTDIMVVKAQQYDEAIEELQAQVRSTGLTSKVSHEGVANDAKVLADLEQQLEKVNESLGKFHGLPPVRSTRLIFFFFSPFSHNIAKPFLLPVYRRRT